MGPKLFKMLDCLLSLSRAKVKTKYFVCGATEKKYWIFTYWEKETPEIIWRESLSLLTPQEGAVSLSIAKLLSVLSSAKYQTAASCAKLKSVSNVLKTGGIVKEYFFSFFFCCVTLNFAPLFFTAMPYFFFLFLNPRFFNPSCETAVTSGCWSRGELMPPGIVTKKHSNPAAANNNFLSQSQQEIPQ